MNRLLVSSLLAIMLLAVGTAQAEKADQNQPMNVQADFLRYDNVGQTSVFSGNVVLTKGSIVIRGERLEVRQDADGYQYGLVVAAPGKLAFFRQKREGVDEFIEGEGQTIDYDGRQNQVRFITNAQVRRYRGSTLADQFSADQIAYNNNTEVFTLDGGSPGQGGAGRARAILVPAPAGASSPVTPTEQNRNEAQP